MKLKNKKTGEIVECLAKISFVEKSYNGLSAGKCRCFDSIDLLNEDWEDAPEEPKEYWWVSPVDTDIVHCVEDVKDEVDQYNKGIGNYFETKEEAELAVRKLKAWKRLKDKGFRFIDHIDRDTGQGMTRYEWDGYINGEDLDLLFGGEE